MDASTAAVQLLLLNQRQPTAAFDGCQVAVIRSVDGAACTFVIPAWDPSTFFGPAPLPAGVSAEVGQTCVVAFVGSGADQPYVLAVYEG